MKKIAAFILFSLFTLQTAFAASTGPAHKLGRGVEGIVTSPLEYVNQLQISWYKYDFIAGTVGGLLGGTFMTVKRIVNGAYDIVTFPVSFPKNNGLLLPDDAETALDNYYSINNHKKSRYSKQRLTAEDNTAMVTQGKCCA